METHTTLFSGQPTGHSVPPSGGSLEIGNKLVTVGLVVPSKQVPPSGGSLEIGNPKSALVEVLKREIVPPSGGSLEIGNSQKRSQIA